MDELILGIDMSTKDIAFSLIDTINMKIVSTHKLTFEPKTNLVQKIMQIKKDIKVFELIKKSSFTFIENNITNNYVILMRWVNDGLFGLVGYLIGLFKENEVVIINNNTWKKALNYKTPVINDYKNHYQLVKAKEASTVKWVETNFGETVDSDIADATLIAFGGWTNGKTIK